MPALFWSLQVFDTLRFLLFNFLCLLLVSCFFLAISWDQTNKHADKKIFRSHHSNAEFKKNLRRVLDSCQTKWDFSVKE